MKGQYSQWLGINHGFFKNKFCEVEPFINCYRTFSGVAGKCARCYAEPLCKELTVISRVREEEMITQDFIDSLKYALQTIRDQTQKVEDCTNNGDLAGALKEIAILIGHSLNLQAMTAGKATYELSKAEEAQHFNNKS